MREVIGTPYALLSEEDLQARCNEHRTVGSSAKKVNAPLTLRQF